MLLDEPFAGIDPIAVGDIQGLVRHLTRRGIGVLITDHNVRETLDLIDRAYILHAGRVIAEGHPPKSSPMRTCGVFIWASASGFDSCTERAKLHCNNVTGSCNRSTTNLGPGGR